MLFKCCTQYASKFGKLSSGHRIGKGQFSLQSPKRAMPKNAQSAKECSIVLISHASKVMLKIFQAMLQLYMNCELPDVHGFIKGKESRNKLPTPVGSLKKQESSRKTSISALLIMPKLWLCRSQQTVENSSTDGHTRPPDLPLEKSVCRSRSNS